MWTLVNGARLSTSRLLIHPARQWYVAMLNHAVGFIFLMFDSGLPKYEFVQIQNIGLIISGLCFYFLSVNYNRVSS